MTLQLGGDGAITGCTSLEEPTLSISGLIVTTPIEAISGTAAAPAYTFSGDTDNGLYYAGTNSIGLSTAGNDAILIDSAGNVGIGDSSPGVKLEVKESSANTVARFTGAATTQLEFKNATVGVFEINALATGLLSFGTGGTSDRMRIDSSGNVGIGSSNPTADGWSAANDLVINHNTGNSGITIKSGSSAFGQLVFNDAAGGLRGSIAYDHTNEQMSFATAGTGNRLLIDSSGNVGIGNTAPGAKLQIEGTSDQLKLTYTSIASYVHEVHSNGDYSIAKDTSERIRINSSGNVGIGTSSPSTLLHLETGHVKQTLKSTNLNTASAIIFDTTNITTADFLLGQLAGRWNGTDVAHINFEAGIDTTNKDDGVITFLTSEASGTPLERMRIDNTGKVGIGQVSPASRLDVNGNQSSNVVAIGTLNVDCSAGNYFTKTINGNSTFTFSNVPASRSFAFVLELTHTSGTVTWPASVKFPDDTAPTLTTGKTHLFIFETNDGGTRFRGAALVDYVN